MVEHTTPPKVEELIRQHLKADDFLIPNAYDFLPTDTSIESTHTKVEVKKRWAAGEGALLALGPSGMSIVELKPHVDPALKSLFRAHTEEHSPWLRA